MRFIPACVGNSLCHRDCWSFWSAVHPRVCGELSGRQDKWKCRVGSSPRVWGTPSLRSRMLPDSNGSSPRVWGTRNGLIPSRQHSRVYGSSPRVWGTPFRSLFQILHERFIPACVGNSPDTSALANVFTVHPRVCGELLNLSSNHA